MSMDDEKRRIHPHFSEAYLNGCWQDPASGEFGLGFKMVEGETVKVNATGTVHVQITRKDAMRMMATMLGRDCDREDIPAERKEAAARQWVRD